MSDDRGDGEYGDARVEALLRRFGDDVRDPEAGALFELPRDRGWLERRPTAVPDAAPARRLVAALAAAAALAIVAGTAWWLAARGGGDAPAIRGAHLASAPGALRGDPVAEFRSGERIWLHFESDGEGQAVVALIDSRERLVAVATVAVQAGPNSVGPFTLDDETGTETLILVTGAAGGAAELDERLRSADPGPRGERAARVRAIEAALADANLAAITYEHVP